jgi:hypothetical protein
MRKLIGMMVIIIISIGSQLFAQDPELNQFRVELSVTADDSIKNQVLSYLLSQFRSLNDVSIIEADPDWRLSIIIIEDKTVSNQKIGYTASVVIAKKFDPRVFQAKSLVFDDGSSYENWPPVYSNMQLKEIYFFTSELHDVVSHYAKTCGLDKLEWLCSEIVAGFDIEHLQPARKRKEKLIDLYNLLDNKCKESLKRLEKLPKPKTIDNE